MDKSIHLWVEMSFLEGNVASNNEMSIRNILIDKLELRQFGRFAGAGSGNHAMDFSFFVADEKSARRILAETIGDICPEIDYTVRIVPE